MGPRGWKPPETIHYRPEIHGNFFPELLYKCDSFSYDLLELSTLITKGHLPFNSSQLGGCEEPSEKALELIQGEDYHFSTTKTATDAALLRCLQSEASGTS